MNSAALISVIVPVYSVEKYLPKCIESIINQTYKNLEIILVDDGSPDNCPSICDEYAKKDNRIKVIHKQNGGVSSARNAGIAIAAGEYLMFCDSDDYFHPQQVEKLYLKAKEENADITLCGYVLKYGNTQKNIELPFINTITDLSEKLNTLIMPMCITGYAPDGIILPNFFGSVCRGIYKKSLITDNAIVFPTEVCLAEDMIFNIPAFAKSNKIACIKDCLYTYVNNPNSVSRSYSADIWKKGLITWEVAHNELAALGIEDEYLRWYNYQLSKHAANAILVDICAQQISKKQKLAETKLILSDKKLKAVLKNIPKKLTLKKRVFTLLFTPSCAYFVLMYYQKKSGIS